MTLERQDTRLASQYEAVRRQEYELISRMLEVLPRVDGISEDQINQLRDALFHADTPYLIVFVGPFSSGKSSLINALLGRDDILPVGITPTTERITMLRQGDMQRTTRSGDFDTVFYPSTLLNKVSLVDTPGLESVFEQHEAITRHFLHRSDAVILVMLATQAMTATNLEYLKLLKEYGKTVIVAVNQVDLLSHEEIEHVRAYVAEQSRELLHTEPRIWLMSARKGLDARHSDGSTDATLWTESGLEKLEKFVDSELGDAARMRQKLQTPLQIAQNVHQASLNAVQNGQAAIDRYQAIQQNVDTQIAGFRREDERLSADIATEIRAKFEEAGTRGAQAVRSTFGVSKAPRALLSGISDLIGLRRAVGGKAPIAHALEAANVNEPLTELRAITDKLGPRLEAKDVQDIDSLVKYAQREIDALPSDVGAKLIGKVEAPSQYDRSGFMRARTILDEQEIALKQQVSAAAEKAVRDANVFFATYEIVMAVIVIFLLLAQPSSERVPLLWAYLLVAAFVLALLGIAVWIVRGNLLANGFSKQLKTASAAYMQVYDKVSVGQIDYGVELRRSAINPLTRLVEAQTSTLKSQLNELHAIGQQILAAETALTRMQ